MTRTLLISGIAIALLAWILPSEIVNWQIAAAHNDIESEEIQRGIDAIERLAATDPENLPLQLELLQATAANKDRQAIAKLAIQLNEAFPNNEMVQANLAVAYHTVGMHRESYEIQARLIADEFKQLQAGESDANWDLARVNNFAYASFLADMDTELWYQLIQSRMDTVDEVRFAIYLAEALRLVDEPETSAEIMEMELNRLEAARDQKEAKWRIDLKNWMSSRDWPMPEPPTLFKQRELISNIRILISQIASQGWRSTEGTKDLQLRERFRNAKAIDLMLPEMESNGKDTLLPVQEIALDNSPKRICQRLEELTTYIDTRGCLAISRRDFRAAKRDLDKCLQAITLLQALSEEVDIWNSPDVVDVQQIERAGKEARRSWAVILYHRSLVYAELGDKAEVDNDYKRIRDLGYQPGPELF